MPLPFCPSVHIPANRTKFVQLKFEREWFLNAVWKILLPTAIQGYWHLVGCEIFSGCVENVSLRIWVDKAFIYPLLPIH